MNILFLTYDFPFPTNSGGKNRAYHMMKFGGKGHTMHLFSFVRGGFQEKYIAELQKSLHLASIATHTRRDLLHVKNFPSLFPSSHSIFHALYYSEDIANKLKEIVAKESIDVIHYESYYTAFYLKDKIKHDTVKHVFGTENIEHKIYSAFLKERIPSLFRPFVAHMVDAIQKEEVSFLKLADMCIAVTEDEASCIRSISSTKTEIIENGIDVDFFPFRPKKTPQRKILFVGNFSYFPNQEAIKFFCEKVYPHLEEVSLTVVGKRSNTLPFASDKTITCIDFTPDIRDVYYDADVFVSPVRFGGGTNFKILEAMASGVPVVAFPQRLESMGLKHKEHLLVAEDPEDFAKSIEALLDKKDLRDSLIKIARKHVETRFSWVEIGKKLSTLWSNL